jgi:hypothetical protein
MIRLPRLKCNDLNIPQILTKSTKLPVRTYVLSGPTQLLKGTKSRWRAKDRLVRVICAWLAALFQLESERPVSDTLIIEFDGTDSAHPALVSFDDELGENTIVVAGGSLRLAEDVAARTVNVTLNVNEDGFVLFDASQHVNELNINGGHVEFSPSHPTVAGTYLAACVTYAVLFDVRGFSGAAPLPGLSAEEMQSLQRAAAAV